MPTKCEKKKVNKVQKKQQETKRTHRKARKNTVEGFQKQITHTNQKGDKKSQIKTNYCEFYDVQWELDANCGRYGVSKLLSWWDAK